MKIRLLLFTFLLLVSCSNDKKLLGKWYGHQIGYNQKTPILIKFQENNLIDYFSNYDTLIYKTTNHKIIIDTKTGEKNILKYKLENTELKLFDSSNDSLLFTLNKSQKDIFALDYLSDKSLEINLPKGNGVTKIFGSNYKFNEPIYLAYKNDRLVANFRGFTTIVDNNFHELLLKSTAYNFDEKGVLICCIF